MPFRGKPRQDKIKVKQNDHPEPILNINLPEPKPPSDSDSIGTWVILGKDGDQDRQRRPSKTSGASREETSFGPDVLFDQDDLTPPPRRRKPTLKSMAHNIAKTVRGNKGASNFEDEHQAPLSPTTYSQQDPDEATSVDVHSPRQERGVRNESGLEGVSEHPLLLPNRIPTLESYIEPSQDNVGSVVEVAHQHGADGSSEEEEQFFDTSETLASQQVCPYGVNIVGIN